MLQKTSELFHNASKRFTIHQKRMAVDRRGHPRTLCSVRGRPTSAQWFQQSLSSLFGKQWTPSLTQPRFASRYLANIMHVQLLAAARRGRRKPRSGDFKSQDGTSTSKRSGGRCRTKTQNTGDSNYSAQKYYPAEILLRFWHAGRFCATHCTP